MITEGTHKATVEQAVLNESMNGTPGVKIKLNSSGEVVYADLWLSDAAMERSVKTLQESFGFDGDFSNLDQLLGKECEIVVQEEEYNGETRPRVRWINPIGGKTAKLDPDKAQSLAKSLTLKARRFADTSGSPF